MAAPRPIEQLPDAALAAVRVVPRVPPRVPSGRARAALRRPVLAWFDAQGRPLAFRFRGAPDPWTVLVSEVIAQQTQVGRLIAGGPARRALAGEGLMEFDADGAARLPGGSA